MLLGVVSTALLMGLVGGPHCLAMCAAPCHGIVQGRQQAVHWQPGAGGSAVRPRLWHAALWQFHLGRMLGYAALGAVAAQAMAQLAWLTDHTAGLHSLWALLHLAVLAWGLLLLFQGQQPAWLERAGRQIWRWAQPVVACRGGAMLAGCAWVLMPCGLLYSALLVAALSGGAAAGAVSMLAFAAGGALWLVAGPWLWHWMQEGLGRWRAQSGTRVAGGLLVAMALWALWRDLVHLPAQWCR